MSPPGPGPARFQDLAVRMASGVVLAGLGAAALWAGGPWLLAVAALSAAVMVWEAATITAPGTAPGTVPGTAQGPAPRAEALALAALAGGLLVAIVLRHDPVWLALLFAPAALGAIRPRRDRRGFAVIAATVMLAAYGMVAFRDAMGLAFVLWIVGVVAAVDLLGYFGGRIIGGPKFWPRLSPKKTWSGTIAGWAGAAAVGAGFAATGHAPLWVIPFSALVGFAAQMGDIGESAVKRRAGVKDASHLIPGHGGLMDRFDGLSGAILFLILWGQVLPLPGVVG